MRIAVERLTKRFGTLAVINGIELSIEEGELFTLLGPSGCGKTTLLRLIAGFNAPDAGDIRFDDRSIVDVPPHQRGIGMVFQNYALWPHMTVLQNVGYGLKLRGTPAAETRARIEAVLGKVRLAGLGERFPGQLSGGQQQRVALARALVLNPQILLLDEPLSNLDARLRLELRSEIRRVCKEFQLTTVYVTHDQKEALSMADRMAVLTGGRILQVGTPPEVYRCPARRTVANFIGEADFVPGAVVTAAGGRASVDTAIGRFDGVLGDPTMPPKAGAEVTVAVHPECWALRRESRAQNCVEGRIGGAVYLGDIAQYEFLSAAGVTLKIVELNPRFLGQNAPGVLYAHVEPEDVVVLVD